MIAGLLRIRPLRTVSFFLVNQPAQKLACFASQSRIASATMSCCDHGAVRSSFRETGGFAIDLMLKDLGLATDAAKLARQPVYLGALAQQLYQAMSTKGAGRLDFSSVIKLYVPTQVP
jgi:3-hydroxyisobutyrate dehydrogenase-like beta-hydroxyacid dehydrogenase